MVVLAAAGVHHFFALMSFGLCMFVTLTIVFEFFKGSAAIAAKSGQNFLMAMVELTHRNTRRYGGYVVHLGIVAMFIGFSGAAFNKDATVEVKMGDTFKIGHYQLKVKEIREGENENYQWGHAAIDVYRDGNKIGELSPEQRMYKADKQPASVVSIRRRLNEDLYLNFAGMANGGQKAVIQAYVFPLVSWIWIGAIVLVFGTFICLVPSKVRYSFAKTKVMGVVSKDAAIAKS
ncbi:MAG: hypothetical protein JJE04_21040 [Acidobacteriia bacterium]|nr:hypothetical protein [Terriglobia bacterium]